jgi:hypothetical protein
LVLFEQIQNFEISNFVMAESPNGMAKIISLKRFIVEVPAVLCPSMGKLKLTGQKHSQVFNFRSGCARAVD